MLFRRMFVKQYNILQKFILLVALGYFIWWLNGGIDDLKYQVYKEKREEVVKMILEGEIKKEVSSKLIDLPEKYKIISSGGDILYLESPLSDSVFGFWETRGIVSSGSTMYIYSCQEENQLKKIIRKQPKETIIPAIFPIFKIPFNKKGSKKIIKLMIKNISNKYFIIFIVSPTWIHSNKK